MSKTITKTIKADKNDWVEVTIKKGKKIYVLQFTKKNIALLRVYDNKFMKQKILFDQQQ